MARYNRSDKADIYSGTSDDDLIYGGRGYDELRGNGGNDIIYAGGGWLPGYDRVWGGDGNDTIYLEQNPLRNYAYGEAGDDTIFGGIGLDTIDGGWGNDHIEGGGGADTIYGDMGDDTIVLGIGHITARTTVDGGDGADKIHLNYGFEMFISGGAGDDIFYANRASLTGTDFDGGSGYDSIQARFNESRIGIRSIRDIEEITGDGRTNVSIEFDDLGGTLDLTKVKIIDIAKFRGSDNADTLYLAGKNSGDTTDDGANDVIDLGRGNDVAYSGFGNDTVAGGDGNDKLFGDFGNDQLEGGNGSDTFIFRISFGNDVIADFSVTGGDVIEIAGFSGIDEFSDLATLFNDVDGSTVINFTPSDSLSLVGVSVANLSANDFLFVA
ncbi:calcium-binding protein [Agrobacterium tumefaciens]|nr:calcium-binding protein [Agrobacterium tumefaciens]